MRFASCRSFCALPVHHSKEIVGGGCKVPNESLTVFLEHGHKALKSLGAIHNCMIKIRGYRSLGQFFKNCKSDESIQDSIFLKISGLNQESVTNCINEVENWLSQQVISVRPATLLPIIGRITDDIGQRIKQESIEENNMFNIVIDSHSSEIFIRGNNQENVNACYQYIKTILHNRDKHLLLLKFENSNFNIDIKTLTKICNKNQVYFEKSHWDCHLYMYLFACIKEKNINLVLKDISNYGIGRVPKFMQKVLFLIKQCFDYHNINKFDNITFDQLLSILLFEKNLQLIKNNENQVHAIFKNGKKINVSSIWTLFEKSLFKFDNNRNIDDFELTTNLCKLLIQLSLNHINNSQIFDELSLLIRENKNDIDSDNVEDKSELLKRWDNEWSNNIGCSSMGAVAGTRDIDENERQFYVRIGSDLMAMFVGRNGKNMKYLSSISNGCYVYASIWMENENANENTETSKQNSNQSENRNRNFERESGMIMRNSNQVKHDCIVLKGTPKQIHLARAGCATILERICSFEDFGKLKQLSKILEKKFGIKKDNDEIDKDTFEQALRLIENINPILFEPFDTSSFNAAVFGSDGNSNSTSNSANSGGNKTYFGKMWHKLTHVENNLNRHDSSIKDIIGIKDDNDSVTASKIRLIDWVFDYIAASKHGKAFLVDLKVKFYCNVAPMAQFRATFSVELFYIGLYLVAFSYYFFFVGFE